MFRASPAVHFPVLPDFLQLLLQLGGFGLEEAAVDLNLLLTGALGEAAAYTIACYSIFILFFEQLVSSFLKCWKRSKTKVRRIDFKLMKDGY